MLERRGVKIIQKIFIITDLSQCLCNKHAYCNTYLTISPYCARIFIQCPFFAYYVIHTHKRGGLKKIAKNVEKLTRIEHHVLVTLKASVTR